MKRWKCEAGAGLPVMFDDDDLQRTVDLKRREDVFVRGVDMQREKQRRVKEVDQCMRVSLVAILYRPTCVRKC